MEIFIATSIKSFDLNPTHPGPLPRVSFHTSATQHAARPATDEVGDELQKNRRAANGKQHVARAESSCEFLRAGNYVR